MIEKVVRVEVYMPEEPVPMCTIEVTGPCSIIGEKQLDTLEMYFESEKRSGGGEVADSKFDFENNMVLVTFESEEGIIVHFFINLFLAHMSTHGGLL